MTQRERDQFFQALGRCQVFMTESQVRGLIRAASAHLRACEGDCSIEPPDGTYDDDEAGTLGYWSKRRERALKTARGCCPDGWRVEEQTDPRGGTLWLENEAGTKLYPPAAGFPASVYERRGS